MKQLTFWEERDVYSEWYELLEPYIKGISGACYLCPMDKLCKSLHHPEGIYNTEYFEVEHRKGYVTGLTGKE